MAPLPDDGHLLRPGPQHAAALPEVHAAEHALPRRLLGAARGPEHRLPGAPVGRREYGKRITDSNQAARYSDVG